MATATSRRREGVLCSEVEEVMREKLPPSEDKDAGDNDTSLGAVSHREGIERAMFRERVRRAGRRVVVFGLFPEDCSASPETQRQNFDCIQNGKAVEPSFAKGEWAVRLRA